MSELSDYRRYISDPHIKRLEETIHSQALRIKALEHLVDVIEFKNKDAEIKAVIAITMRSIGEPAPVFEAPGKKVFG